MGLEPIVIALSVIILVIHVFAWRWSLAIERSLIGQPGHELANTITWIIGWSTIVRVVGVGATVVFGINEEREPTLLLAIAGQVFAVLIFIGAILRVRRMSGQDDSNSDPPTTEGGKRLERVGVEVD